jgi:hypothetical protein
MIPNLLAFGLNPEQIGLVFNYSIEEVIQIIQELDQKS